MRNERSPGKAFLALVAGGVEAGRLQPQHTAGVGDALAKVLETAALRDLGLDQTSMTIDRAREWMDSILYAVGTAALVLPEETMYGLLSGDTPFHEGRLRRQLGLAAGTATSVEPSRRGAALQILEDETGHMELMAALYAMGRELVAAQVRRAKRLLRAVRNTKTDTPSVCYNETIGAGMGLFFARYNAEAEAHEIPGDIDYPLAIPMWDGEGVAYITAWLERLLLENRVCRRFAANDIHRLLEALEPGYEQVPLNLMEPVLQCAMGCLLSRSPPLALCPDEAGMRRVCAELAKEPGRAGNILREGADLVCRWLHLQEGDALAVYVEQIAEQNAATLRAAAQKGNALRFFGVMC